MVVKVSCEAITLWACMQDMSSTSISYTHTESSCISMYTRITAKAARAQNKSVLKAPEEPVLIEVDFHRHKPN
jgi:hypothetical protein